MRINSFVESAIMQQDQFVLPLKESHHLARVLRVKKGQKITVFDGQGEVAEAIVKSVHKSAVEVCVIHREIIERPTVQIDLIQAIPKPDRWEWVLQKAVELGVSNIYPLSSQHTLFKSSMKKEVRWNSILLHAAQQCEVRWMPTLHAVSNVDQVCDLFVAYDAVLVGSLYDGASPFRNVKLEGMKRVALVIGPEGDFTEEEISLFLKRGAVGISFGDRILRTETASIYGLSVLAYSLF